MARSLYYVHHQPERIREESKIIGDGKKCVVHADRVSGNLLLINLCHELGRAKKAITYHPIQSHNLRGMRSLFNSRK
jgi:hypothetical protein